VLGESQLTTLLDARTRARLLPGDTSPVTSISLGQVRRWFPAWLTDAYGKLIRCHLSASLHQGEIDAESSASSVIYMTTETGCLFRPNI